MDSVFNPAQGFAFGEATYPNGGTYGPHHQPTVSLVLLYEGEALIQSDENVTSLVAGQCALFRSRNLYIAHYTKGLTSRVSWCDGHPGDVVSHIDQQFKDIQQVIPLSPRIEMLQKIGIELGFEASPGIEALRGVIADALLSGFVYEAQLPERDRFISPSIQRVRAYIDEHFHRDLKINELASVAALTPQHLIASFRRHLGITPIRYLWQIRAERAKILLVENALPNREIAELCGYTNQFHFSRQIKNYFGKSPSAIRAEHGKR